MALPKEHKIQLSQFFETVGLRIDINTPKPSTVAKREQILAYMEVLVAELRKFSKKRRLVLIESCAGNCYLSFAVYYYCTEFLGRAVTIHCLDWNSRLMEKGESLARELGFTEMYFHAGDVSDYLHPERVDMVYSLHACDTATDKSMLLGVRNNARCILSVSCCQHTIKKGMRGRSLSGMTRHRVLKERLLYMVGDAMRALLLTEQGYAVDMVEFVSSRHTDKNVMIRARSTGAPIDANTFLEYQSLKAAFNIHPSLETYLGALDADNSKPLKAA